MSDVSLIQQANVLVPIFLTESGRPTEDNQTQKLEHTELGMSSEVSFPHSVNASSPIFVTESGMTTEVSPAQLPKAEIGMDTIDAGITNDLSSRQYANE